MAGKSMTKVTTYFICVVCDGSGTVSVRGTCKKCLGKGVLKLNIPLDYYPCFFASSEPIIGESPYTIAVKNDKF